MCTKLVSFYVEESVGEDDIAKGSVKGTPAYRGIVQGRVKLVFERNDIDEVNEGDILVTPMTTPNLLPAMKKAAAFVTDEGGITCHAAIAAREMKKPCVIGTKIATLIFKNGDEVEVNANDGLVEKL
jgi:pyruvate, water dikinase